MRRAVSTSRHSPSRMSKRFIACLTITASLLNGPGLQVSTATNREVEVRPLDRSILTPYKDFVLVL